MICIKRLVLLLLALFFPSAGFSATYYLDAAKGDDAKAGNQQQPWKTLAKAQQCAKSGDMVILASGEYGSFVDNDAKTAPRTDWITYKAAENAKPLFSKIQIVRPAAENVYLRFDGITVKVDWVEPGADPQMPNSRGNTYKPTAIALMVAGGGYVEFRNGKLLGTNRYLTPYGIHLQKCHDILVEKTEASELQGGAFISETENVTLRRNHIHGLIGSGIKAGVKNKNLLIESNHIHDSNWKPEDNYAPRAAGQNPHASAISIRTSNLTIRNNIFHDIGSSSGMMFYIPDAGNDEITSEGYSNILVENNLMYDTQNTPMRIYCLGSNVVFRNNTFISYLESAAKNQLYLGMVVQSIATKHDGSGLSVFNNIFAGICQFPPAAKVEGNILGALNDFQKTNLAKQFPPGNHAFLNEGKSIDIWLNGFFSRKPELILRHKTVQDFHLSATSPAINFGKAQQQTARGLGTLDENDFVQDDGVARDEKHHSAGCYEFRR